MGTRSKRSVRCPRCRMHVCLCICDAIPRYDRPTRLVLVMHHREVSKTTATGPLALEALVNSELRIQGVRDVPLDFADLGESGRRILLLYPGDDAPVLDMAFLGQDTRPVTLVVPDGNWRQAGRMSRKLPGLEGAEKVRLPAGPASAWGIRREHVPEGLATFEAIARAFGILESREVQVGMEKLFALMVDRTRRARGAG